MRRRLEDLVREAAANAPDRVAVVDDRQAWTYRELDARSNGLAHAFWERGVRRGDRVALWAPKSCDGVAAMQAALRLGAAYVPIDPVMPPARVQKILADAEVRLVATTRPLAAALDPRPSVLLLEDVAASEGSTDRTLPVQAGPDELAYVLYTSGSTGTPKGVCLSHRNGLAFVEWAVATLRPTRPPIFANHASFGFDLSVLDLYGAFLTRGRVCLVPETIAYSAPALVGFLRRHAITVWYSVPSVLTLMMERGGLLDATDARPEIAIFAGEPFPIDDLRRLRKAWPEVRLFNFYGPTETNVCASYEVMDIPSARARAVPIGTGASGDRVWLVKDDGSIAAAGEIGELWVEGPTVMLGYWGRGPQTGPYQTGDFCRREADGNYEFVGRRDHLVKVRGHRVELGEIESVLAQHPNVKEVVVFTTGEGVEKRLEAAVVPRQSPAPTLIQLKTFEARSLPTYMLIDRLQILDALPRTLNGKVDRQTLAGPVGTPAP